MTPPTSRHEVFAKEFLVGRNATQAAIRAGYSQHTAKQQGSRLLTHVDVRQAVESERARLRAKAELRAEDVIRGLREIAEDESAPHAARVSAWKALGNHLGLFQWNPVAEGVTAFLTYLADGGKPTVEAEVRHLELLGSSSA